MRKVTMNSQLTRIHAQHHVADLIRAGELNRAARPAFGGASSRSPMARIRGLLARTYARRSRRASPAHLVAP